jgi:hypothetical protein
MREILFTFLSVYSKSLKGIPKCCVDEISQGDQLLTSTASPAS